MRFCTDYQVVPVPVDEYTLRLYVTDLVEAEVSFYQTVSGSGPATQRVGRV